MRKLDARITSLGILSRQIALGFWFAMAASTTWAANNVAGNLITFNDNGAWSWYMDERSIVDPVHGKLLVGSVKSTHTTGQGAGTDGNIDVVTFDLATGSRTRVTMNDIAEDDHNAPGLMILPDGRYLAMYSNHGNTGGGDYLSRYRISANQGSTWSAEQSFNWQTVTGWNTAPNANNRVSYHNLNYLSADNGGEGRIYNFSRGTHQSANSLIFNETTNTWSWGGQLTESATGGYSTGYIKYASNNVDRIYFMSTETHPRSFNNNIYVGYISDGVSYDMNGTVVDGNIFDNDDTGGAGAVPDITEFTKIFESDPNGPGNSPLYSSAWTVDFDLGPDGNPYGLFTARWKDDDPLGNGSPYQGPNDNNGFFHHTLFYARYDGTNWHVNPVAKMGQLLYSSEEDYTGLGAIDPGHPNTIYISTPLDPTNQTDPPLNSPANQPPTYQVLDGVHEIYKGVTADGGQTWSWTPITQNSTYDNFRPIIPRWDEHNTAVAWFRGTYSTAQAITASVVGIVDRRDEEVGLAHYVDATSSNTTLANGSPISGWSFTGSDFNGANGVLAATAGQTALKTTLAGLDDGEYDVFAYFWVNLAEDWRIQAGLSTSNMVLFREFGAQQAELVQFDSSVVLTNGTASLYRAYVGRANVLGGASIDVFIDELASGTNTRTWYDGLGYALVSDVIQGLAGDFNGDLVVDATDYTLWRDNLGAADEAVINGNGDGMNGVDLADYDVWKANFGTSSPASGGGAKSAVPEPATGGLLCFAVVLAYLGRRRWSGDTRRSTPARHVVSP